MTAVRSLSISKKFSFLVLLPYLDFSWLLIYRYEAYQRSFRETSIPII